MGLLFTLLLIVAGVLGAAALIVQKQPNARDVIAKLVPFQGIIGIILLIWSLIMLIRILPYLGLILQFAALTGILALLTLLVGIALGFLLGYGLINQYVLSKNAGAARSGDTVKMSLAKYQGPLGIVAILLGLWMLISVLSSPFPVF
jgi:hypothetical protein